MFCGNCGSSMEEDSAFCGSCGNKIEPEEPAPQNMFCGNCGKSIDNRSTICSSCGYRIKPEDPDTRMYRERDTRAPRGWDNANQLPNPIWEKISTWKKSLTVIAMRHWKKSLITIAAVVVLIIGFNIAPDIVNNITLKISNKAYQSGLQAMADLDYSQAVTKFSKVIDRDPNYYNAQSKLSQATTVLENSNRAYENGLQAMADLNYSQAITEFRKVIVQDKNYNKAQTNLTEAIRSYKNYLFASFSALENIGSYKDIIKSLNTALALIPADNDISTKLTHYTTVMYEKDKEFVSWQISEINMSVASSNDYASGITKLKSLLNEYPAFNTEINSDISKFTKEFVSGQISEINMSAASSNDYDGAITKLKSLLNEYPAFNSEITAEITKFTAELMKIAEVSFNKASVILANESSATLSFKTSPADIKNIEYTWKSSDPSIVTVNNGQITAKGFGAADISIATADGTVKAACKVSVNPILGRDIKAYQLNGAQEFSRANTGKMMGAAYEYGFSSKVDTPAKTLSSVYYNIKGQYESLSGLYGPMDQINSTAKGKIRILGDGRPLAVFDVKSGDAIKSFTVNVTGITQIAFEIESNNKEFIGYSYIRTETRAIFGLANLSLFAGGSEPAQFNEPFGIYNNDALLARDIKAYQLNTAQEFSRTSPVKMMGTEYEYGFFSGDSYPSSFVYYNINGKYKNLSGVYGPIDGINKSATGTIKILGDGKTLATFNVRAGDTIKPFSINVAGITQIAFEIKSNNDKIENYERIRARFGLADMTVSLTEKPLTHTAASSAEAKTQPTPRAPSAPKPAASSVSKQSQAAGTPPPAPSTVLITLTAGTPIKVIIHSKISTETARTGNEFTAVLNEHITSGDRIIVWRGSIVKGVISDTDPSGSVKGVATMSLRLTSLELSDGRQVSVTTNEYNVNAASSAGRSADTTEVGKAIGDAITRVFSGKPSAGSNHAVIEPNTPITFNLTVPLNIELK